MVLVPKPNFIEAKQTELVFSVKRVKWNEVNWFKTVQERSETIENISKVYNIEAKRTELVVNCKMIKA
jgi:hypothetical protein